MYKRQLTDIPMSCCLLHSDCRFLISARVFSLKDAVFSAFFIFVLNAAISLQPLAYTLEPKSEMTKIDAIIFFILHLQFVSKRLNRSIFFKTKLKKIFFQI